MRCISGVTTTRRSARSSRDGIRMAAWLNVAVAFSTTSKARTATAGAPSATTAAILSSIESRISAGWKRSPVVASSSGSAWWTRWSRHKAGTVWVHWCCQ